MRQGATDQLRSLTSATSMATRLPAAVITVSLVSLLVATIVGVRTGSDLGQDLTDERLVALRSSGTLDVVAEMDSLSRTADALAASPQAVVAVERFTEAYRELFDQGPGDDFEEDIDRLISEYQERYLAPLAAAGRFLDLRDLVADNPAALYLQSNYAVDLGVIKNPATIDDANDGSAWTEVHDIVHPVYRDVAKSLDLFDVYLIEPEAGTIVYSVNKRPDIGTSLDLGPFSGSLLASVVDEVRLDPSGGAVVSDLSFYDPALLVPVGAIASPIMDGERLVGVLVLMYDGGRLTELLTADSNWDDAGFPPTGETFLIGADGLLRSDQRGFLEDPELYLDAAEEAGTLDPGDRPAIEAAGTTVLLLEANDETVNAAIDGLSAVEKRPTVTGTEAFSTIDAIEVNDADDVGWLAASQVEVAAAEGDLDDFVELLVVGAAIFIVSLAFLAVAWAARIVRPVRAISERLGTRGADLGPIELSTRSPIEFRRLAQSFESMSQALVGQQTQLAGAREERLALMRRMLPPGVAERVASGDIQTLEEVPQASVVVVVVRGLGDLVRTGDAGAGRQLIDQLHGELDDLAERHGLERVKVVGDAYFAACGHARPFIDHAPRVVSFALDARDAVRDVGELTDNDLHGAAGVHTGAVTVGVTGGARLLYDVWGESVTGAHYLARRARQDQVLVSEETHVLMPTNIEATPAGFDDMPVWSVSATLVEGTS